MNVEIELNNTVSKTVIEFNYFIHNCLDTGSFEMQMMRSNCGETAVFAGKDNAR